MEEDVRIYWIAFGKQDDIDVERVNTRKHCLENSLWKGLWTRRKTRLRA